ncbi:hypothetical protein DL96DRAFT_1631259 [Flagelloscypha sp. PMI_526]|nr:hypothetical protein DL96DRAFT_1631259 [Flagelloscypha sp. PMI_526]
MIISPEKSSPSSTPPPVPPKDILPPAYSEEPGPSFPGSDAQPGPIDFPLPKNVQPCNHLHFSTGQHSMEDKFIIDPNLVIPPSLLPPLCSGETDGMRANLSLQSKHSHISGEAWIVPGIMNSSNPPASQVVRITAKASRDLHLLVHNDANTMPLRLSAKSSHGRIKVFLPRMFTGTISASTRHGKVHFSPALRAKGTLLGNVDKKRRIFIGDLSSYEEGGLGEVELKAPDEDVFVFLEDEWSELTWATTSSIFKESMKKIFGQGTLKEELRESISEVQRALQAGMDVKVSAHPRIERGPTIGSKARVLAKKRLSR